MLIANKTSNSSVSPQWTNRIIIGGLPRSGSTLFRLVLDSSDTIICPSETGFFVKPFSHRKNRLASSAKRINRALNISEDIVKKIIRDSKTNIEAFDLIMSTFRQQYSYTQKNVWAEKSPRNCFVYPELNEQTENIRFISIVRDGRGVVTSRVGTSKGYHCSIDRYISTMKAVLGFKSSNHHIVKYEDLVTQPRQTISKVFAWLDLPFCEDWITEYAKPGASRNIDSHRQNLLGKGVQETQIYRWKLPEHKNRVASFVNNKTAVELLVRSGYKHEL